MGSLWPMLLTTALLALVVMMIVRALAGIRLRVEIRDFERGLLFRSGRVRGVLEPGSHWLFTPFTRIEVLDVRSRVMTVAGQEVLSADNVSVRASVLLRYRIADPARAFLAVQAFEAALYAEAQLALRRLVGAVAVEDLMARREEISAGLAAALEPHATATGLVIESAGLRDLTFPPALKQALHQVVEARKAAQASLERARGEGATLRSLANAARLLEARPGIATLRAIQAGSDGRHTLVLHVGGAAGNGQAGGPVVVMPEGGAAAS